MKRFRVLTLVDITETRQYRKEVNKESEYQQQQNFNTLLQTIGMRVNPIYETSPHKITVNVKDYSFGSLYSGEHTVWCWDFGIEYEGGFTDETGNPIGLLVNDINLVPIISKLSETADLKVPVFDTKTAVSQNTIIQVL